MLPSATWGLLGFAGLFFTLLWTPQLNPYHGILLGASAVCLAGGLGCGVWWLIKRHGDGDSVTASGANSQAAKVQGGQVAIHAGSGSGHTFNIEQRRSPNYALWVAIVLVVLIASVFAFNLSRAQGPKSNTDFKFTGALRLPLKDSRFPFNFYFRNDSDESLRAYVAYYVEVLPKPPGNFLVPVEDDRWAKFTRAAAKIPKPAGTLISAHSAVFQTFLTPVLPPEYIDDLVTPKSYGSTMALVFAMATWKDEQGTHETDYCAVNFSEPDIFLLCQNNNGAPDAKALAARNCTATITGGKIHDNRDAGIRLNDPTINLCVEDTDIYKNGEGVVTGPKQ